MRKNGWEAPFHYLQVITWVFFPAVMALFFAFTTPLLDESVAYIGSIVYGVVCIIVVYSVIRCTGTDPSDDSILQRTDGAAPQQAQSSEEQLYCNVCVQYVHKESRHCRLCDKCVTVFDHHCKWLNNCVGKKNYRFFLMSVVGATTMLMIQVGFGVFLFSKTFSDSKLIKQRSAAAYGCPRGRDTITKECIGNSYHVPIRTIQVVHGVLMALLIPWCYLIMQLTLFHFQLCIENITTYDYIVRQRKRKLQRERENIVRLPWWRPLYARICCQRVESVDGPTKAGETKSERVSRSSFNSETEEQAAIEAEVDEDLEVLSARSGEVGGRASMQIGRPSGQSQGPTRGFGLHINFNQDGSLQHPNSTSNLSRTPGPGDETNYVAAPVTPRSPRSDPSTAYLSEISDTEPQPSSSVVMLGRPTDLAENHVV